MGLMMISLLSKNHLEQVAALAYLLGNSYILTSDLVDTSNCEESQIFIVNEISAQTLRKNLEKVFS